MMSHQPDLDKRARHADMEKVLHVVFAAYDGEDPVGFLHTVAAIAGLSNRRALWHMEDFMHDIRNGVSGWERSVHEDSTIQQVVNAAVFGDGPNYYET